MPRPTPIFRRASIESILRALHDRRDLHDALLRPATAEAAGLEDADAPAALRRHQWDKLVSRLVAYDRRNDMRLLGIDWAAEDNAALSRALDVRFMADRRQGVHVAPVRNQVIAGVILSADLQKAVPRLAAARLSIASADSSHALFALYRQHPGGPELLAEFDDPEILTRYALEVIDAEAAARTAPAGRTPSRAALPARRFAWLRPTPPAERGSRDAVARLRNDPTTALMRLSALREGERLATAGSAPDAHEIVRKTESVARVVPADRPIAAALLEDPARIGRLVEAMAIEPGATVLVAGAPSPPMVAAILRHAPRRVVVVPETAKQAAAMTALWRHAHQVVVPDATMADFLKRPGPIRYDSVLLAIPGAAPQKAADVVSWAVMTARQGATISAWLQPPEDPEDRLWPTLRAGLDRIGFSCAPLRTAGDVAGGDYLMVRHIASPAARPGEDSDRQPPGPEPA